ncbi:MAG: glycosyltransferase family A protein [Patescibacteria group bacterium]|nr:glycosyltransferase family A protein [Patescibacteria group bacterium]
MPDSISVIIPVCNHAKVLGRCFESIKKQTRQPLEIIVVNDGSTDDFLKIIGEILYLYKDLDIKTINQENKGAATARNSGLAEASGEYVIFWDADTVAKPRMLEKMFLALKNNSRASYAYSQFKFGWKKIKSHPFDAESLKKINYIDTTSLIRRADLPARGWDESLKRFQDWDLWLSMLEQNKTGVFIPEVLYVKIVGGRKGMSRWIPSFLFKLPLKIKAVKDYEDAKKEIIKKHNL